MKETYMVNLPKKIVFGDPLYFEEFKGKKLDSLVVDFSPPRHFEAVVVLQESPFDEFPDVMNRTMTIFLAPAKTMGVYLNDMIFESQDETLKEIGVDTAQYYLKVDDIEETIRTGGDGYWGGYMELSRTINGHRILDAAIISISMPEDEILPLFSAGRSRKLTLVPIIQSLAQLEKNYGKEGAEIIADNCQDTIFGGFAPNSQTAEVLSKALGERTVMSGSVSKGKDSPSQSVQMMGRPLMTPDELKSLPKGDFIVMKTGTHPMRTHLHLLQTLLPVPGYQHRAAPKRGRLSDPRLDCAGGGSEAKADCGAG